MNSEAHSETYQNQTKDKENFERSKRDMTHKIQVIFNKIISRFQTWKPANSELIYIQSAERKTVCDNFVSDKNSCPSKLKDKLRHFQKKKKVMGEFITIRPTDGI